MSGNTIAYHLRENKSIERNLFIDLLRRVGIYKNISDYQYIGFGGPFLEDFKLIHHALRINDMHSIERDENTHKRQKFNKPTSFINLHNCESDFFFNEILNTEKNSIVWLDYTAPRELPSQISELLSVASQLGELDILKITVNANPATLGGTLDPTNHAKLQQDRLATLRSRLGDYMIDAVQENDLVSQKYPFALQKIIRHALAPLSTRKHSLTFKPLASFKYKDGGHTMLTITGVMINHNRNKINDFFKKTRFKHWKFSNTDWAEPLEISVPTLSIKERLHIEQALPLPKLTRKPAERLQKHLGFWPCSQTEKDQLENYANFYRLFPYFSKVNPT
ncbi:O-methyltransferase [Alcaligenes nematophilus]|uniref:O-methyltransferase n=1 Tax=Alcaligenes nematophilus TaxID=2994643 RepID=UPI0024621D03|nr:O-methyltransferase [Alcaligenes nematophilus]MDH4868943.1 hypothetical protein [Bacillus cereus]MDY7130261.1 O-methyltransferase [Alcaligenes nematophilus]